MALYLQTVNGETQTETKTDGGAIAVDTSPTQAVRMSSGTSASTAPGVAEHSEGDNAEVWSGTRSGNKIPWRRALSGLLGYLSSSKSSAKAKSRDSPARGAD
jgi:hypothetical protein